MKHLGTVPVLVLLLAAGFTTQASAQLFDVALKIQPILEEDLPEESHVDVTIGTGVNNASGKTNAFAVSYERNGPKLSFAIRGGYLLSGVDEPTLGASIAAPITRTDGATISFQGGIGYIGFDAGIVSITNWSIPLGVGFQRQVESTDADIRLSVMPRLQFNIASGGGTTNTATNFGASAGVSFDLEGPLTLHAEGDYLNTSGGDPLLFSVGGAYQISY